MTSTPDRDPSPPPPPVGPTPLADLIASVGLGVVAAQRALDASPDGPSADGDAPRTARYRIPQVDAEIALTLAVARPAGATDPPGTGQAPAARAWAVLLDARDSRRYGYDMSAATRLRFTVSS